MSETANIVEQWMKNIRSIALDGLESNNTNVKNWCFNQIIGHANSIITTVTCAEKGADNHV